MIRLAADENFDNHIIRALCRAEAVVDVVRVQDVGLAGADDPAVLEWAAANGRVLLTHDYATMPQYELQRVSAGLEMPGVVVVRRNVPIMVTFEDLLLLIGGSDPQELRDQVVYLPL